MTLAIKTTEEFAGQVVGDVSATFSGVMTNIGHKLGLYKAMVFAGRLTSAQLSEKTALTERYVRDCRLHSGMTNKFSQKMCLAHM